VERILNLKVYGGGMGKEERRLRRYQRFMTQCQNRVRQQSQKRYGDSVVAGLMLGDVLNEMEIQT
jgi:hypothetical protein